MLAREHGLDTLDNRSLEGSKQWTDMIWFMFVKAHSGCCVQNRLEDAGMEAGNPVKRMFTAVFWGRGIMVAGARVREVEVTLRSAWI